MLHADVIAIIVCMAAAYFCPQFIFLNLLKKDRADISSPGNEPEDEALRGILSLNIKAKKALIFTVIIKIIMPAIIAVIGIKNHINMENIFILAEFMIIFLTLAGGFAYMNKKKKTAVANNKKRVFAFILISAAVIGSLAREMYSSDIKITELLKTRETEYSCPLPDDNFDNFDNERF